MRQFRTRVLIALAGLVALMGASARAADPVNPAQLAEVRAFLDQYAALSRSQSPDFYDLYSDHATVHARIKGQVNEVAFSGRSYKDWSRQLLLAHRIAIDVSEFRDAMIEQRRGRIIIRAKRFADSRCFWDVDYQVALEREANFLKIVDERFTSAPEGVCQARQAASVSELRADVGSHSFAVASPPWRPMTQEEIARSALKLAREVAGSRNDKAAASPIPPIVDVAAVRATRTADPERILITPADN